MKMFTGLFITIILLFSSCSGYIGENLIDIQIDVPDSPSERTNGRYISSEVELIHLVFVKDGDVYGYLKQNITQGDTTLSMPGLPADDYVLVALLVGDDSVGFAAKEVTIKAGFNNISLTIGPGFDPLEVNGTPLDDFIGDDSGYSLTFAENTIIVDTDGRNSEGDTVRFSPTFGGSQNVTIDSVELLEGGEPEEPIAGSWVVPLANSGVIFKMTHDETGETYTQIIEIR